MEEFKELFLLLKEYIQKQKENMTLGAAESMTKVFFAVAMGALLLFFGGTILLLGSIALSFWIKEQTGSFVIGFSSTAGVFLILAFLVWLMRRRLVLQPIARLMVRIFLDSDQVPENNNQIS
ncbi:MAG: hypothetical protein IIV01_01415 [Bacteroidaceae bacterium]|nr:hypothetical protein [Bacteroidaceae bacterium]MBQ5654864.1 hypothetical protein [Bacteroidaceae bacterium]